MIPSKMLKKILQERAQKLAIQKTIPTQITPRTRSRTQAPQAMEDYLNYGMGAQKNFYTNQGAGSMSMSPLASTDSLVAKLGQDLGGLGARYAEGGKVTLTANAIKALKDALSHLQNKDRRQAVSTLRSSREAMANPRVGRAAESLVNPRDNSAYKSLQELIEENTNQTKMATMADGGGVEVDNMGGDPMGQMGDADPHALYAEYQELVAMLESGKLDEKQELMVLQQMQQLEQILAAMGIDVSSESADSDEGADVPNLQGMMQQLTQGTSALGIQ